MGKPLIGEVVVLPFPQTNLKNGKLSVHEGNIMKTKNEGRK